LVTELRLNAGFESEDVAMKGRWLSFRRAHPVTSRDTGNPSVDVTTEDRHPLLGWMKGTLTIAEASTLRNWSIRGEVRPRMAKGAPAERKCHVSGVTSNSKHDRISEAALSAFLDVSVLLPKGVPVIVETPVDVNEAGRELRVVARLFEPPVAGARA
jgi:hypothetical protein